MLRAVLENISITNVVNVFAKTVARVVNILGLEMRGRLEWLEVKAGEDKTRSPTPWSTLWSTQMEYPKNTISNEYCWSMCKQHLK